ncbi:MAG: hypothetical protein ACRCT8_00250 [Lacipirellulaceae bacterium]
MKPRATATLWIAAAALAAHAAGCGPSRPATHPVAGRVVYSDGEPVRRGVVEFLPVSPGPSGRGVIDDQGAFTLGTFASDDGAVEGQHRVIVAQPQVATGALVRAPGAHGHGGVSQRFVAWRYASPATSGLSARVIAGTNALTLTIEAPPAADRAE